MSQCTKRGLASTGCAHGEWAEPAHLRSGESSQHVPFEQRGQIDGLDEGHEGVDAQHLEQSTEPLCAEHFFVWGGEV